MKKTIAIFILLALSAYPKGFSDWLEKRIDAYFKNKIKKYSKEIKIKKTQYIFPNKLILIGIFYNKDGFSLKGDGSLEVNIALSKQIEPILSPKVILKKPQFSVKDAFFKKKKRISLPNIEIIVEDGRGNIADFGTFNNVSGYVKNKGFRFNGSGLGGKACIEGKGEGFKASIKDAKIDLLPYLVGIKKRGLADITIKKEKEMEIVVDIKNGSIMTRLERLERINGMVLFKGGGSKGHLVFLHRKTPVKIKFNEKMGLYKINGDFFYNKTQFPFSIEGSLKNNAFRLTKGNIKNTRFFGRIKDDISLSLFFDNEYSLLPLFHPALSSVILNGSVTITGQFEKPNITGSLTLTKNNDVLSLSICGDNNILSLKTGTISLSGIKLVDCANGTLSLKPFFISCNLVNPLLFKDGKIEGGINNLEVSLLSEKRRLFIKKGGKDARFKYADIIKGFPVDCYGGVIFEKERAKILVEYGKIGQIPINNGLCSIRLKDGLIVENFEFLIDDITSIHSQFEISKNKIDAPLFITNIKTNHLYKNLKALADFKGRIIGDIKNPTIFGQLYSPEPKITADIIMIEDSLILKNGRIKNTIFEFSFSFQDNSISGFTGFEDEEISTISFILPSIEGRAKGKAIFSGSLYNPEIVGSITVLNPLLFGGIYPNSINLDFNVKDKVFSSKGCITSDDGSVSFNTNISNGEIDTGGNISNFKLASLPITGSLSFKGLYRDKVMEGTLSLKNIGALGYKIPDIVEVIQYQQDKGLRLSGIISGKVKKGQADILVSLTDFKIGQGKITGTITACGETENPEINGEIEIRGSALKLPIFLESLDEVLCKIKIEEGIIRILNFKGRAKKTRIALQQIKENVFEVKTEGEPIKIDIPGVIKGEALCELMVSYNEKSFKSEGKIIISNARFTYPPTKEMKGASFLDQVIYGVRIEAGHNVWFYNELCEAEIEKGGFLRLQKIDDIIKPEGSCHSKKGRISYLEANFILQDANFEFRDGIPYLTGYAERIEREIPLTLSHSGIVSLPIELCLSSKAYPEKTHNELVKILQGGKESPAGFIARIVGGRITGELTRSIQRLTGTELEFATPFLEEVFSGTQTYSYSLVGTEVKIGRYLTQRFYLIYEYLIKEYEGGKYKYRHRIGFEYDIGRKAGFRYLYTPNIYTPKKEKREQEHEFGIKKSISF